MQRIDENTYIDDTLVTCAEYQLFIDEMREQGKYHQPDHWTSYQFPEGQAREPILGVRQSDAIAFCEWLKKREGGGWNYRLSTSEEARVFPAKVIEITSLGYWGGRLYQFNWVRTSPKDARVLDHARFATTLDHTRALNGFPTLDRDLNRILDRAFNRNFSLDHTTSTIDGTSVPTAYLANAIARAIISPRAIDRTRALNDASVRALDFNTLNLGAPLAVDFEIDRHLAFDMYIDIFTLRERIAGRSPAFEGIRLVKERTK